MEKQALRAQILRDRLSSTGLNQAPSVKVQNSTAGQPSVARTSDAVISLALANDKISAACKRGACIASYESFGSEPPTAGLNLQLAAMGATVVVPQYRDAAGKLLPEMVWGELHPSHPARSAVDSLAELDVAVIIIPALAVGQDLFRLGRGGGYYDRALAELARYPRGPFRLALVYAAEVLDAVPREAHDEPVDDYLAV